MSRVIPGVRTCTTVRALGSAMKRIVVIGAGYVGLVTGACLAALGHQVTCLEIDRGRLAKLRAGVTPFHEPGLDDLLQRCNTAGLLAFDDDYAAAIPAADFVFLAVNTPPGAGGHADTSFVFRAVESIAHHVRDDAIVVTKSTVPVGTGDRIEAMLHAAGRGTRVVSNPEFLAEGTAVRDFFAPDRIVVGAGDPAAASAALALYDGIPAGTRIVTSRRSAELAKYAANALLASRISFMNEIAGICDSVEADIEEVRAVVGADSRIGPSFLRAGLGWGGSCFPKDVQALAQMARDGGIEPRILESVTLVNAHQRELAANLLVRATSGHAAPVVALLGLAFKPNTDDLREAPATYIIRRLLDASIQVRVHDPVAPVPDAVDVPGVTAFESAYEAAAGAHALILCTEW
ncbi:MAG TPA: UDP-glucose/GDP-mannose dehydrogenase family protein, partial [Tepidiformaceae bacterium]|nr:UDP-glucose/GDP-mannose dehydrogenase family protein [Tepidiformaceae bacterium]